MQVLYWKDGEILTFKANYVYYDEEVRKIVITDYKKTITISPDNLISIKNR